MNAPIRSLLLSALLLAAALPARGDVADALSTPYPDPVARVDAARAAAADGSALTRWALAEALLGTHAFGESDREFARAREIAVAGEELDLDALGDLARRLRARDLRDDAIAVLEHRIDGALAGVPDSELLTRGERELVSLAIEDLKTVAALHRELLRWDESHAARERAVRVARPYNRASELAEYLDELLWSGQTAHARSVASRFAELESDPDVLRKCAEVMILEGDRGESHRLLRLAVASEMEYWYFRDLLNLYLETFDPGVRWASDRDDRLAALLMGRPRAAVDHLLLGAAYHAVGERELEEQAYRSYLNTGGVTADKLRTAGDLLFEMGKTADAFLLFQRYLAEYPAAAGEPAVLLRVVDCLERTYDLKTSFHGAFNAFGYLFLDERTPQVPVGVFSLLFNDVPLDQRMEGLEDALDRYYVDLLAVDLLWNVTGLEAAGEDAEPVQRAYRRLLGYYQRYEDDDRQLEICQQFVERFPDDPEANEFRFDAAAIHNRRSDYAEEERSYRTIYEATAPPPEAPRPFEPTDHEEQRRHLQHERSFRSLISLYDRDRVARFHDVVALYKLEIDLRGGQLTLIDELVRVCEQRNAYDQIEAIYSDAIASYDTMALYDRLARHYLRTQRAQEAEKIYRKALKRFADQQDPYTWLSNFYGDRREYDEAAEVLRVAAAAFPDDLDWYRELAGVRYRSGGDPGRCQVYREALDRFPHEWIFVSGLVGCLGSDAEALALLEAEQAVLPEAREWMLAAYGQEYLFVDRLNAAEARLAHQPDDALLHRYVGDLYDALSAYEQSLEHYEIAAATLTDDAWLLARVGDLQRSFERHDDAARSFALLAEMKRSGWADASSRPVLADGTRAWTAAGPDRDAWVVLGEVRAEGGDGDGALSAWRRVIDRDRSDPAGWLEVASACWDYFLFDEAIAVFDEERRTLGDPNLHAKQLAAVHESKRDYPRAITEYVTILRQGDPMVREDVRIRLVYLARNKGLDRSIRTAFERAIKADPDHEGLYRNYADFAARLEDWPAVYSIYGASRRNVRDRRYLEWLAGEFERLDQQAEAEVTFADLARTFGSDASAWNAYLAYVERRYEGRAEDDAAIAVLTEAHGAMPTAGFHWRLIPKLEARGDDGGIDRALRQVADAMDGAARFAALHELAIHRAGSGDRSGAEAVFAEQRALRLTLVDHPETWSRLAQVEAALLDAGADELAREHLTYLERDLALEYATVDTWVAIAAAWQTAGRGDRALLDRIQAAAPYRVDVARMIAEQLLAAGDEAAVVEMFEDAAAAVGKLQDTSKAVRGWSYAPSARPLDAAPAIYGHLPLDAKLSFGEYGGNPFGEFLASANPGWLTRGGYGYGYGYDYEYEGYDGYHGYRGYHGYDGYHGDYDYDGYADGPSMGDDPVAHGKRARREMRRALRRALIETVVPRGMRYDGVTAYERMVNEDPLDAELLDEAWRFAALNGYGEQFRAYYGDVQREADRDFRWYRVMARLAAAEGDLVAQADWLEKLLLVEPHRTDVHRELAGLYRRLERPEAAIEHLDRVRFLEADEVGYLRDVAELAYAGGDPDRGVRELLRIRELAPDDLVIQHQLVADLTRHGEIDRAADTARAFVRGAPADALRERESMYHAWTAAYLTGGRADGARAVWWQAYDDLGHADAAQFSLIYTAPGMGPSLRRDFEARQEEVVTDRTLQNRFLELFAAEHLYREEAALRTLVADARLLDQARVVATVFGESSRDRRSQVPSQVRRLLGTLGTTGYGDVHRRVSFTPADGAAGDPGSDHARAIAALLAWERLLYTDVTASEAAVRSRGSVSNHRDVANYAVQFDRSHRELAQFYRERRLFLDAAAELRQVETLFGPLYNDVYMEQLDLLVEQAAAGVEVERALDERDRVRGVALDAAVAELVAWPDSWRHTLQPHDRFRSAALFRYLRHAADAGDTDAFVEAREKALSGLGIGGPYRLDGGLSENRLWTIREQLRSINQLAGRGPLELAMRVHLDAIERMPDESLLQVEFMDLLAARGTRAQVEEELERRLADGGRLWLYRWGATYLRGQEDLAAAIALADRGVDAYPGDVDLRLARIELRVQAGELSTAAAEASFLVGGQTVGGFLQGAQLASAPVAEAPLDQTRTALGHHSYHLLTTTERERLFEVMAAGTGDEDALSYLIERHPRRVESYERMARAALLGGHHELALASLERAEILLPEHPQRFLALRGAIHWDAGDEAAARVAWRQLAREPYPEAVQEVFDLLWERDRRGEAVDLAAGEIVRRRGFDPAAGGLGRSILSWAGQRIDSSRDYDLLADLYLAVAPALSEPSDVADLVAHLRQVHRPDEARALLDAVLPRLDARARQSLLYSEAALARGAGEADREDALLGRLVELDPDDLTARSLHARVAADAGRAEAVARSAEALERNRTDGGLRDAGLAPSLLRLLARSSVEISAADADRLGALLDDPRYDPWRDALVFPRAELELAAGRSDAALALLRPALDAHPAGPILWGAAGEILGGMGGDALACGLRSEQAGHLLTYAPADPDALLLRARAEHCAGETPRAVATAAEAAERNPGLPGVQLERARVLLEIGRPADALALLEALQDDPASGQAEGLLLGDAALAAGDPARLGQAFTALYDGALTDAHAAGDRLTLAVWAADEDHPGRAVALAPALEGLGRSARKDPRPDRLAAALYRQAGTPDEGEAALRRSLERAPHHPTTQVALLDLLLAPEAPAADRLADARGRVEELAHTDPHGCDVGRLRFRVQAAAGEDQAWELARGVPNMGCAGVPDLERAEAVLVEHERYDDAIRAVDRLIQLEPDRADDHRQRREAHIAAHEAQGKEAVR